jgi:hypothetical protein
MSGPKIAQRTQIPAMTFPMMNVGERMRSRIRSRLAMLASSGRDGMAIGAPGSSSIVVIRSPRI